MTEHQDLRRLAVTFLDAQALDDVQATLDRRGVAAFKEARGNTLIARMLLARDALDEPELHDALLTAAIVRSVKLAQLAHGQRIKAAVTRAEGDAFAEKRPAGKAPCPPLASVTPPQPAVQSRWQAMWAAFKAPKLTLP